MNAKQIAELAAKHAAETLLELSGSDFDGLAGSEAWINAAGHSTVASELGVKNWGECGALTSKYRAALETYDRAFRFAIEKGTS